MTLNRVQRRPAGASPVAVLAEDLHKTYKGGVTALDGLGFAVPAGGVFALLGPNGAGKSTTVRILTTLTRPDAGRAEVAGIDVVRRPAEVRARIGVVTQSSGSLTHLTGRENLVLQARVFGLRGPDQRARVDELLAHFDLQDAADRLVRGYSGGMRRRLDLAVGLIHRPEILFLDEPTTGLDPEARSLTWSALQRLVGRDELTVVLTTHYLEEADQYAGQVAIVDRGRIVAAGSPDELKQGLHGDTLFIELPTAELVNQAAPVVDRAIGGRARRAELTLVAQVPNGARALPGILTALEAEGIEVTAVRVARPSLDQVYLHFAGRSLAAGPAQEVAA
jgi:ABC-2 type transport system ATP-binding protein